eukprot:164188-Pelagomonas_calceolata.AAC.4
MQRVTYDGGARLCKLMTAKACESPPARNQEHKAVMYRCKLPGYGTKHRHTTATHITHCKQSKPPQLHAQRHGQSYLSKCSAK